MVDRSVTPLDVLRVSRTIFHDDNNKMSILCTLTDPIKKNAYYNAYYIVARKARSRYYQILLLILHVI